MIWLLQSIAFAQAEAPKAAPSMLEALAFPILTAVVVYYFIVNRPQQKRLKEHQDLLSALKRGDKVITNSGIFGEVTGVTEKFITLEVSDNVRIRILKSQIAATANDLAL